MEKSAEAIVAEPNRVLMTSHPDTLCTGQVVAGSGAREGSREGLNVKQRTIRETWNLFIMGDRFPTANHPFRWKRCKVQLVKRAVVLFDEPPYT